MRLAVVDIETTDLRADKGFILVAGVQALDGADKRLIGLHNTGFGPNRYALDRRVVLALREEMLKYDGWVTWNGLLFDLPFVDDRLMIVGGRPLEKRFARGLDLMWHARSGKSTFTSSRLDWVAKAMRCPLRKTDLDLPLWKDAEAEAITHFRQGREAFDYVVDHNDRDLEITAWMFPRLKPRIQTISKR